MDSCPWNVSRCGYCNEKNGPLRYYDGAMDRAVATNAASREVHIQCVDFMSADVRRYQGRVVGSETKPLRAASTCNAAQIPQIHYLLYFTIGKPNPVYAFRCIGSRIGPLEINIATIVRPG